MTKDHEPNTIEIDVRQAHHSTFDSALFEQAGFKVVEVQLTVNRVVSKIKVRPLVVFPGYRTPPGSANTTERYGRDHIKEDFNKVLRAYASRTDLSCRIEQIIVVSYDKTVQLLFKPFRHKARKADPTQGKGYLPPFTSMVLEKINGFDADELPIDFLLKKLGDLAMNSCYRKRRIPQESCNSYYSLLEKMKSIS